MVDAGAVAEGKAGDIPAAAAAAAAAACAIDVLPPAVPGIPAAVVVGGELNMLGAGASSAWGMRLFGGSWSTFCCVQREDVRVALFRFVKMDVVGGKG